MSMKSGGAASAVKFKVLDSLIAFPPVPLIDSSIRQLFTRPIGLLYIFVALYLLK
jgi:hypothetical protein